MLLQELHQLRPEPAAVNADVQHGPAPVHHTSVCFMATQRMGACLLVHGM
jgi:hypothetical protein